MKKVIVKSTLRAILLLAFLYVSSKDSYACDTCTGHSPGDTWCDSGILYSCNTCSPEACIGSPPSRCYVDPSQVQSNWEDCDFTCPADAVGKYTKIEGTCSCTPTAPSIPNLQVPDDNAVSGPDYDVSTSGYQVFLDWAPLAYWGNNCFPGGSQNHYYELYVGTSPIGLVNGLPLARLHKTNNGSQFSDFTGIPGTTYYWTVVADNGAFESAPAPVRSFIVNTAPLATFVSPSIGNQPPYNVTSIVAGVPTTFSVTASDTTNNLTSTRILARKFRQQGSNWVWDMPNWLVLGETNACAGGSCSLSANWSPNANESGNWWIVTQVTDTADVALSPYGKCSGDPGDANIISPLDYPDSPFTTWSNCGNQSRVRVFVASQVTVRGYLWNSTNRQCSVNPANYALNATSINESNIFVRISNVPEVPWQPNATGYNYLIQNVTHNPASPTKVISTSNFTPRNLPNFRYQLTCAWGNNASVTGTSVRFDTTSTSVNTVHLGYKLVSTGWFTSVNGNVYGGYTDGSNITPSVEVGIPLAADIPLFNGYLIEGAKVVIGNESLSVKNPLGNTRYSSSGKAIKLLHANDTWPQSYDFIPPSNAVSLSFDDCAAAMYGDYTLHTDKVYLVTTQCLLSGFNTSAGDYVVDSVNGGRIAVMYVRPAGANVLRFNRDIKSSNNNRILFVSQAPVEIVRNIGVAAPSLSTPPNLEVSIISKGGIRFIGTTDSLNSPDTSLVIEGPLVTGGASNATIHFDRDRGTNNGHPAEVVVYNPDYLYYLTKQERDSTRPNYTGLSVAKINWEYLE